MNPQSSARRFALRFTRIYIYIYLCLCMYIYNIYGGGDTTCGGAHKKQVGREVFRGGCVTVGGTMQLCRRSRSDRFHALIRTYMLVMLSRLSSVCPLFALFSLVSLFFSPCARFAFFCGIFPRPFQGFDIF